MTERKYKDFIQQRVKEALASTSPHRSYDLMVGNERVTLPVISVPTNHVFYNHNNHRLSAQLQDQQRNIILEGDPYDASNQTKIHRLLVETEEFNRLKDQLASLGQKTPALITPDGLLVNGNTRCAALKELEKEGKPGFANIEVAVTRESFTETDIANIEMNLQMVKLVQQDYTFTNELIFMKNFMDKLGKSEEALARQMDWRRSGKKKVRQHMRILGMIDEVRSLKDPPIPYKIFDTKREVLFNLDDELEKLINSGNLEEADQLKYTRFFALFAGLNKDQIREIDTNFIKSFKDNLNEKSKESKLLGKYSKKKDSVFNTDFDDDEILNEDEGFIDTKSLLSDYMKEDVAENEDAMADLIENLDSSTDSSIQITRDENRNTKIVVRLQNIKKDLYGLSASLDQHIASESFKPKDFEEELVSITQALEELKSNYSKLKK